MKTIDNYEEAQRIDFINSTAKTTLNQILAGVGQWVFLSWGVSKMQAVEYENHAALQLKVSGANHKGWVMVVYHEWPDVYEIRTIDKHGSHIYREEVYCDELGEILDALIEKPLEWSDEEYHDKAMADSAAKL